MKRHLELTAKKLVQQAILLNELLHWDSSQLDEKLVSLQLKGIVILSGNNPSERIISLVGFSEEKLKEKHLANDDKENELRLLLEKYLPKY
ncbi:MAG: hypothetical protein ACYDA4_15795 [Ignavibacteriaceae bacterium]